MQEWIDKDHMMLTACFQLLVDFIEEEKAFEKVQFDPEDYKELLDLYRFWKYRRPVRITPLSFTEVPDDFMTFGPIDEKGNTVVTLALDEYPTVTEAFERTQQLEQEWYEEDTDNLLRLVKIRHLLWV